MRIFTLAVLLMFSFFLRSQKYDEPVYTVSGKAIKGYDAVAYFTKGEALEGSEEFKLEWKGSTWLFSSFENLNLFEADSEKFAPQYGGYCAWGMSKGYKAKVDPANAWTIHDGKLYLNYNKGIRAKWIPKKKELIEEANQNWMQFE